MEDVVYVSVGGSWTVSGGARTQIKLSRPWQTRPIPRSDKCPLCVASDDEVRFPEIEGWKVIPPLYTPHEKHRLIVPDKCWDEDELQCLKRKKGIKEALSVVQLVIKQDQTEIGAFIHVGRNAGQNMRHPHWHCMQVCVQSKFGWFETDESLIVASSRSLVIWAGGTSAGECLIIPKSPLCFKDSIDELSQMIEWIVFQGNRKFRSREGLPPDFMVSVRISSTGYLLYADYLPVLSIWGAPERVFAPIEGGPYTLPWPHKATADLLKT